MCCGLVEVSGSRPKKPQAIAGRVVRRPDRKVAPDFRCVAGTLRMSTFIFLASNNSVRIYLR